MDAEIDETSIGGFSMPMITQIYALGDFTGTLANTTETQGAIGTAGYTGTGATFSIDVNDDDAFLEDAFIETGSPQTLNVGITIDGTFYAAGTVVELEYSATTDTGIDLLVIRINGVNVGIISSVPLTGGEVFDIVGDGDGLAIDYDLICFARDTLIQTPNGQEKVQNLGIGDLVVNKSGAVVPIRWVGKQHFSAETVAKRQHLRPVKIAAGALGDNIPSHDLMVSQQHRVFLSDWRADLMFGFNEFLAPAKALLNGDSITLAPTKDDVEYFHIMFDQHEVICSNGQWTESFFPGGQALDTLEQAAHDELLEIFPSLRNHSMDYPMAAPCLKLFEYSALKNNELNAPS